MLRGKNLRLVEAQLPELRRQHALTSLVFAFGTFDLPILPHVSYLRWANKEADFLVVGVRSDAMARRRRDREERPLSQEGMRLPPRPLFNGEENRTNVVGCMRPVDYHVLVDEPPDHSVPDFARTAQVLEPNVIVVGRECTDQELAIWRNVCVGSTVLRCTNPLVTSGLEMLGNKQIESMLPPP